MSYSPWGFIQTKKGHQRGVTSITTSSHGGILVSKGFAEKFLSEAARKRAILWNNAYYCFEEDCACEMVFNELPYVQTAEQKQSTYQSLSRWYPDYLIELGSTPEPKAYAEYQRDRAEGARRKSRDPNMVVAGVDTEVKRTLNGCEIDDIVVKAWTANGSEHLVTKSSYRTVMFESRTCNLSDMVLV